MITILQQLPLRSLNYANRYHINNDNHDNQHGANDSDDNDNDGDEDNNTDRNEIEDQ